jgi:hypothetical protein
MKRQYGERLIALSLREEKAALARTHSKMLRVDPALPQDRQVLECVRGQRLFGPQTGVVAQPEEFGLTPKTTR